MTDRKKTDEEEVVEEAAPVEEVLKPAKAETAKTVQAWVRVERRVTLDARTNEKAEPGNTVQVPLVTARKWVEQALATWSDPRPEI